MTSLLSLPRFTIGTTSTRRIWLHASVASSCRWMSSNGDSDDESAATTSIKARVIQGPSLLQTPLARPNPSLLFLPGLRSLPFWTTSSTSSSDQDNRRRIAYGDGLLTHVVEHLESHADAIRNEYLGAAPHLSSDYQDTNHGSSEHHATSSSTSSLHEGRWDWHTYMSKGSLQSNFAVHFPETTQILQTLREDDLLFEGTPFGFGFFSTLHGQAKIAPHTAPMNLRLRLHLALQVPTTSKNTTTTDNNNNNNDDDELLCGIRVEDHVREWVPNEVLVLDDSYNHQVWNLSHEPRVIFLLDIWHPDIHPHEKREIIQMFQTAKEQGLWNNTSTNA